MAEAIEFGFNGNCAEHTTQPAIARATESTADVQFLGKRGHSFGRLLVIHCATGHQYYAIKKEDLIEDPFTQEEEAAIIEAGGENA